MVEVTAIYTDGAGGTHPGFCWFNEDAGEFWYRLVPSPANAWEMEWQAVIHALRWWGGADGLTIKTDAREIPRHLYDNPLQQYERPHDNRRQLHNQHLADEARQLLRDGVTIVYVPRAKNKAGVILDVIKSGLHAKTKAASQMGTFFHKTYGPGDSDGKNNTRPARGYNSCIKCLTAGRVVEAVGTVQGSPYCFTHMHDMMDFLYGGD